MKAQNIKRVAVVGAGAMGAGIAQNFAQAGLSVKITDVDNLSLEKCLTTVEENLDLFREFGLLAEDIPSIKRRITPFPMEKLSEVTRDSHLLVEAVPEVLELKRNLFYRLDSYSNEIILCSNTSSFTISKISNGLTHPERVIGLHYFYPAHIIPLVEIHLGKDTDDGIVELLRDFMVLVGKKPILVKKEVPGFIVNRIISAYNREVSYLVDEGIASPEDIDIAAKASYGLRLACFGPFEMQDMNGLDTIFRVGTVIRKTLSNTHEPSRTLAKKVEEGALGVKSGKGWYDYQGRSKEQIMKETNRMLLEQLALFKGRQK